MIGARRTAPAHTPPRHATIARMRRALALGSVLASLALAPTPATAAVPPALGSWNPVDQQRVVRSGLMPLLEDGDFHGERPVAGSQARDALHALALRFGLPPVTSARSGRLSVLAFDRLLVTQLGLADVAAAVQREARGAGLRPPAHFGMEVVARMLGLRHDQPYGFDQLELYPWQAITRAEAAFSLARAQALDGAAVTFVRTALARFALPRYTARQLAPLRVAVQKIGMAFVWGGETDGRSGLFGGEVHGCFD